MAIGTKVKPGKDYRLKITDSKKSDEIIYSDYFKVAPKIPFIAKLIPALAVVGGVVFLVGSGGTTPENEAAAKDPIADPPLPGGN